MITNEVRNIKVNALYIFNGTGSYELKLLIELNNEHFILFDSIEFKIVTKKDILNEYNWIAVQLNPSIKYIKDIKEDELTHYFITFNDDSILYIYQKVIDLETWFQDFEIIDKSSNNYIEVKRHMEEDWVEKI